MSARGASRRSAWALVLAVAALLAATSPVAGKTLVRYVKSGGFAGVLISVSVSTTGAVHVKDNREGERRYRLSSARLRGLKRVLADARFTTLGKRYVPKESGADFFTERIDYGGRSVTVQDGGAEPRRLRTLLTRLESLAGG